MWFKNLQLYRLGQPFDLTPEVFEERLRADEFKGCNSMDMLTHGWTSPLGRHGQQLVHAANGYIMICARKEEKIIPAGVIKQLLDDKVAGIEAAEARAVFMCSIFVNMKFPKVVNANNSCFKFAHSRNLLL